jgi:single-strand DNA-binding protein
MNVEPFREADGQPRGKCMNDTTITICGNVLTAPEWRRTTNTGTYVMTFRFASTSRRLDRATNQWVDGDSLRVKVACWRTLGQNAFESVQLGDPLIVHGRLYSRDWLDSEQKRRTSYELDAISVGHDMSRGVSHFARRRPAGAVDSVDDADGRTAIGGEMSEPADPPAQALGALAGERLFQGFDPQRYDTSALRLGGGDDDDLDDEIDEDADEMEPEFSVAA